MEGDEQRIGIVPIDVLRTVAVVTVGVDDSDAQRPETAAQVLNHHGFHVHVAKAAIAVRYPHGVMSRRPNQRKGPFPFAGKYELPGTDGPARRSQMRGRTHPFHVREAEMDPFDVFIGRNAGFVFSDAWQIEQPFLPQLILRVEKPLFAFGMRRADGPVKGGKKHNS